jgi:NADPH2:quinone reductase
MSMRVIVIERLGGPEVLRVAERGTPRPGPGEVAAQVAAAGVNFADIYQREGVGGYRLELPFVPGQEGAGTVTAVGEGVTGLAVGDQVAWAGGRGGYAEQIVLPADRAIPVPAGIGLQVAAAAILQGLTAHYLVTGTYQVRDGDVTVVHAAAGGVGLLLTQMVKARGGIVIATTSGGAKDELARAAGADHVTGYGGFRAVVDQVTGGRGAHVVYEGSARTPSTTAWRRCARAARWPCTAPRAGRCRRSTRSGSTPGGLCSSPGPPSRITSPTQRNCGGGPARSSTRWPRANSTCG